MDREAADTIAGMFIDQEPDEDAVSKSVSKDDENALPDDV